MNATPAIKTPLKDEAKQALREQPRFVLNELGGFVFANHAFLEMAGLPEDTSLSTLNAQQLLQIDDVRAVEEGLNNIALYSGQTAFYFDWVKSARGRYLVASADKNDPVNMVDMVEKTVGHAVEANGFIAEVESYPENMALRDEDRLVCAALYKGFSCVVHPESGLLRLNRAMYEALGVSRSGLMGKAFVDFVDAADRALVQQALSDLYAAPAGEIKQIECRMHTGLGNQIWVLWRLGLQNGVVYAVGRDRTSARLQEAAYLRREQQLFEAQALAHMGHWRWEVGAEAVEWSRELYNIFGLEAENFEPSMDNINTLVHKRDVGRLYQAFQRAIIQQHDYEMDFRIIRPDGISRMVRCEGRCELDNEGEVVALYGIMQDITLQKDHEQALREAKDAAENAYASKSRFLANMSHELRTPLNAIIGFSDLMDKQILGPLGNVQYIDYVKSIRESGMHLLDLITDILDMSKIESGKYELSLEPVNVTHICRTVLKMMEARAVESQITLEGFLPDNDVLMLADRRGMKQILLNLLSNALKFTENAGKVSLRFEEMRSWIVLEVEDTGIGIPAHKLDDVTKPFEQVSNAFSRKHEGSGLGLSITKELVELHGGTLFIDSRLGQGTRVSIKIPKSEIS